MANVAAGHCVLCKKGSKRSTSLYTDLIVEAKKFGLIHPAAGYRLHPKCAIELVGIIEGLVTVGVAYEIPNFDPMHPYAHLSKRG